MISKSGGNQFRGTASSQFQPIEWNANNVGAGTAATRQVRQYRLLARRSCQAGSHLVLRGSAVHRQQERHRPHAGARGDSPRHHSKRHAGRQLDSRLPAVGQGDHEGRGQPRPWFGVPSRSPAAQGGQCRGLRTSGGVVHRRPDVRREAQLRLGPVRHIDILDQL